MLNQLNSVTLSFRRAFIVFHFIAIKEEKCLHKSSLDHVRKIVQEHTAQGPNGSFFHDVLEIMDLCVSFSSRVDEINPLEAALESQLVEDMRSPHGHIFK